MSDKFYDYDVSVSVTITRRVNDWVASPGVGVTDTASATLSMPATDRYRNAAIALAEVLRDVNGS